ncbi:unnamed protein product [Adineta ricciae]|uniref:Uncharacterized protein n=1 Tax=Adineta ricciae TaxID=249248 RepID=A0A813R314_ADIRI|nr:unnamed protein product [Adineta ricciae]
MDDIVGSNNPKHFVEQRRQSIILDYLIATSTHGLRSVGRAYSKFNRIFWVCSFTITCGIMFYFVISNLLQYFSYPTQTKVEIRLDRHMPFPAVTVCSGNPYRSDHLNQSLVSFYHRLTSSNATYNETVLSSLLIPLIVDLFNRNQTDEFISIGFRLTDILLSCDYNGIDCSNAFTASISPALGICYTFNWKASGTVFTVSDYGDGIFVREGLTLSFYMPQELFYPTTWYDNGLLITLHDNDEFPVPTETGIYLRPGTSNLITYQKSETTFLPYPYSNCTTSVSDDLRGLYTSTFIDPAASVDAVYSESLCIELCQQSYIYSQCSCIFPIPFFTRKIFTNENILISANGCNILIGQLACALRARQQLSSDDYLQSQWCSRCVPQCKHVDFQAVVSAQNAPSEGDKKYWQSLISTPLANISVLLPNNITQNFDYYFNRNYLKVQVSCSNKYTVEYNQEAKLSIVDTFSAIGGQTGLWIGLSVLSVIELCELIYRLSRHCLAERKNKTKSSIQPMTNATVDK